MMLLGEARFGAGALSVLLVSWCGICLSAETFDIAPTSLKRLYGEGAVEKREGGILTVDARATRRKYCLASPEIDVSRILGRTAFVDVRIAGLRAAAVIYFEGYSRVGRHYVALKEVRLSQEPRVHTFISRIPEDLKSLHVRVDITEPGTDVVAISGITWGVDDGTHCSLATSSRRKPELLFYVPFDGDAEAELSKGAGSPVLTRGLEYVPGLKGQAVRFSPASRSRLEYCASGNVTRDEGAISLWFKPQFDKEGVAGKRESWRFLFSGGYPFEDKYRHGSGSPYLWFWGTGLRIDRSCDKDSYRTIGSNYLDGKWHHAVFCWDMDNFRCYVDGRPVGNTLGDSDSPFARAFNCESLAFSHFENPPTFFIGSDGDNHQFEGLIDEVRLYSASIGEKDVAWLYAEAASPEMVASARALDANDLYRDLPKENPALAKVPASVPGEIPQEDLELIETVRLDEKPSPDRYSEVGESHLRSLNGEPYLEADAQAGGRFAVGFRGLDTKSPLYLIDIEYPDDRMRTMDVIVQDAKDPQSDYTMQCGLATGHEYANSNRFLHHRVLWWTKRSDIAVIFTTWRKDQPAAARSIRLYRIKSGRLPPAPIADAPAVDGWHRTLALYFEDPAINLDFALPENGFSREGVNMLCDRTAAVMKFTGENLFAYPGSWYHGLIDDNYNPRRHARKFLSAFYEKFDREGLFVMPTFNKNNMPVPDGLVTPKSYRDGTLHDSIVSIHSTGFPNPARWHGSPPNFCIAHPRVQAHIASEFEKLLEQGKDHRSFKGICFHLTRHCMLWWGDREAGYNDYCIDMFKDSLTSERELEGLEAVDRKDPLRGRKYYEAIVSRPKLYGKWLDWRCQVVTKFYADLAKRLRETRPDLRLWVNSQIMMNTPVDRIAERDFVIRNDREAGLDAVMLNASIPNLILGETLEPADYRHRERGLYKSDGDYELQHGQYGRAESWKLVKDAKYPIAGQHDRYFESAIGSEKSTMFGGGGATLNCDWLRECIWRVSTINPPGVHALEHFVKPLRFGDMLGMSKGGFLIGTYGMEPHLAAFARSFRALPAVVMSDVAPAKGPVVLRQADVDGRSYFYICNTAAEPQRVSVTMPADAVDLTAPASGRSAHGERRDVALTLNPYELRSYVAPRGKPSWSSDGLTGLQ